MTFVTEGTCQPPPLSASGLRNNLQEGMDPKQQLRNSISSPSGSRKTDFPRQHLEKLQGALRRIPYEDKMDLVEAMRMSPNLVETESNPIKFLQREGFRADEAARRLATYWRYRKLVFGERAFLPMTIAENGAMKPDDVSAFKKCYLLPLPLDTNGRSVVFFDKAKLRSLPPDARKRCFFYTLHVVAENEKSITEGFVAMTLLDDMAFGENSKTMASMFADALPLTLHSNHIFCAVDELAPNAFYANYAAHMVSLIGLNGFRKTTLHVTSTLEERMAKMFSMGFRVGNVPPSLGGTFEMPSFLDVAQAHLCGDDSKPAVVQTNARDQQRVRFLAGGGPPGYSFSRPPFSRPPNTTVLRTANMSVDALMKSMIEETGFSPLPNREVDFRLPSGLDRNLLYSQDDFGSVARGQSHLGSLPGIGELRRVAATPSNPDDDDVYSRLGLDNPTAIQETDNLRVTARQAVEEAIGMVPTVDKIAYLEALHTRPSLIESESDPLRFVRAENYDSWAAARRLCSYWAIRREVFGERAYLPMTQSGNGALTREDVVVLSCGEVALLPDDSGGRSVLASDRNRRLDRSDGALKARLRSIFYLISALSEEEVNQKDGVVWLDVLISPRLTDIDKNESLKMMQVMNSMPVRIKAAHVIVCPPKTGKHISVENDVSFVIGALRSKLGKRVIMHSGGSAAEIMDKLAPFGLSEDNLPPVMGGSWKYEDFAKWQKQRAQSEQATSQHIDGPLRDARTGSLLSASEKKERKRMLNVIHSRQKRERRRAEADTIEQQCKVLEEKNVSLKKENTRLESMLSDAHRRIALVDQGLGDPGPPEAPPPSPDTKVERNPRSPQGDDLDQESIP